MKINKINKMLAVSMSVFTLVISASEVNAAGKRGPRASVAAATVCAVDGSEFVVETRVRDKTSGDAIARVAARSVDALRKTRPGPWGQQEIFGSDSMSGLNESVPTVLETSFSLCVLNAEGLYVIDPRIAEAKGLNAMVKLTYGRLDEASNEVVDQRTIMNMCSDDPETDLVEPSGIKLDPSTIASIEDACSVLNP